MHGSRRQPAADAGPPAGPRYRRHLAEQPRPEPEPFDVHVAFSADPFSSGTDNSPAVRQGPDFYASYESDCEAADCLSGGRIFEGDLIRALGDGEYAHAECAEAEAERDA